MLATLNQLFIRDLDRLAAELKAYENESDLWLVPNGIANSAGNLALHLLGNLNHFIGAQLGQTGYVRQREKEFNDKHVALSEILPEIEKLKMVIDNALRGLEPTSLYEPFPIRVFADQQEVTTEFMLIHLAGHLNYHLGQINYHRRLLT